MWFNKPYLPSWMQENISLYNREYYKEQKQIQVLDFEISHVSLFFVSSP